MQLKYRTIITYSASILSISLLVLLGLCVGSGVYITYIDATYSQKIYPHVEIYGQSVGGLTPPEVVQQWQEKNIPFKNTLVELRYGDAIATLSGETLAIGYDASLLAKQAYSIGRSGHWLRDIYTKLVKPRSIITPVFTYNDGPIKETLETFAVSDTPAQDALFRFQNGRVQEFKTAKMGSRLNKEHSYALIQEHIKALATHGPQSLHITLVPEEVRPAITNEEVNTFGIHERIGVGFSVFTGSIPGRIHNLTLAASKFHGVLIPPGGVISYNQIVGDISAATGYQPAYIIKDGRTVLGDGGGVCQISTTLFRAGMNAGLPIIERKPHAYRVHYYEDGGFKPGLDATVFAPSVDLKFKNDTPGHILIQTQVDQKAMTVTMEIFGTSDGRSAEIINHRILSESPPPPPLYQDDPTLAAGVVKQVDWAAWGAKTSFQYRVKRNNEIIYDQEIVSVYRPWQAIYLRGTKTG